MRKIATPFCPSRGPLRHVSPQPSQRSRLLVIRRTKPTPPPPRENRQISTRRLAWGRTQSYLTPRPSTPVQLTVRCCPPFSTHDRSAATMLRNLATVSGGVRRPLPGSSSRNVVLLTSRQSSRAAKAKAEDAAARAARLPNRRGGRPLAGPRTLPAKRVGLYDPALEKDSCGVGLAVQMKSVASRQVLVCLSRFVFVFVHRTCTCFCVCLPCLNVKSVGFLFGAEQSATLLSTMVMLLAALFAAA